MEPKIQVLVGMIASGKSTYAKNAARTGVIVCNDDAIVNTVHADLYTLYDSSLKVLYKSTENHIICMALALGRPVLVDRGLNISVNGRRRYLALARSLDVPCEAIVFPNEGPEVHARRRADHSARGHNYAYWLKVATCHNDQYAVPTAGEGFDLVRLVTFEQVASGLVY